MDIRKLPKTEFAAAVAQIAGERNIDIQSILDSIESGLISAYKRDQKEHGVIIPDEDIFQVELTPESGSFKIFKISESDKVDVTPPGFGRIAAQTAKQVIDQKIHEAEKSVVLGEYEKKIGSLVSGLILRVDPYKLTVGIGKTEGICLKEDQVKNETYTVGSKKLFLIKAIKKDVVTDRSDIILSRQSPDFIKGLFEREVPEVGNHTVKIEKIARSPGERTKVAVSSSQPGVDPVGSCIGQQGARIQLILREISESEKIDVIAFSKDLVQFIVQALCPAQHIKVISINRGVAVVSVPEDQLALAIGTGGDNVRLAGIITDLEIKIQSAEHK